MTEADYVGAMKAMSARGWRRIEPVPLGPPEQPTLLHSLIRRRMENDCRALLPKKVIHALAEAVAAYD
jgi:hypothetical protein